MREIKFRAWDKKHKQNCGEVVEIDWLEECIEHRSPRNSKIYNLPFEYIELMQYTGLKDKNGKEIYEGDIVEVESGGWEKTKHEVRYFAEVNYPAFDLHPHIESEANGFSDIICGGYSTIEVIGNIYENSELL